jgi:uncharacterized protein
MLDLLDYRRRVAEMYHRIRELGTDSPQAYTLFQQTRDDLFRRHPQSALDDEQKAVFNGLKYYDYNPAYRITAEVHPIENAASMHIDIGNDGAFSMRPFATVDVNLPTGSGSLALYWIEGYGGGVFLPFRDTTNKITTYGAGRYLLDTIKGADLGATHTHITLDFNYAYHPSCYYNIRWVCPLAPLSNHLKFPVEAGEQVMEQG